MDTNGHRPDPTDGLVSRGMRDSLTRIHNNSEQKTVPTIFKVPPSVQIQDNQAFEPEVVSIGPLHRGKNHLKAMESFKWRYLYDFLKRDFERQNSSDSYDKVDRYVEAMSQCETQVRSHYAEESKLQTKDFREMLVLDGCFIIELMLKYSDPDNEKSGNLWGMPPIGTDLFLIENQIPFFVLKNLYAIKYPDPAAVKLENLAIKYVTAGEDIELATDTNRVFHLLHLYHLCNSQGTIRKKPKSNLSLCSRGWNLTSLIFQWLIILISFPVYLVFSCGLPRPSRKTRSTTIPCAKELWEAGVRFRRKEEGSRFETSFKNGVLSIPQWHIDKRTRSYFLNLMAFQKCEKADKDFFQFAIFMSYLMCTASDVEILERNNIIQNNLGSTEDLIVFFKNLSRGGMPHHARYLFRDVTAYCKSNQRLWRARLASDFGKLVPYFSNPWVIASIVAAVLLLCLNVTQGVYSILKYYKSRS